ncbi:MAG TPA: extracellular solute-binding protein [candidate division Zixibacteria bacterium]|nr:extracellular solute-binding protein [candidate division Zixibacteria bacterium]
MTTDKKKWVAAAVFWCALLPAAAPAQISPATVEAAKKEGEVMFYGAITINASKAIGDLFEKRYGIKLRHWRGDATELINRSLAEARAGRPGFDVTLGNEVVVTALNERNLFADFEPPAAKSFPKQFRTAERRMTPWRVLPYGLNYNNRLLKPAEAPRRWEDLAEPKWKGKFGMANPGIHVTTLQFVLNLEKLLGPKWVSVVEGWAKQEPRLGRSLSDTIQPLTAGEVQVAIGYIKDKYQFPGPIEYVRMDRYLASVSYVAINRQAPHPNAARLFADFFLGPEAQKVFGDLGEYVFHPEVEHRFKKDVRDDQIVVMSLPAKAELESWGRKLREMFK